MRDVLLLVFFVAALRTRLLRLGFVLERHRLAEHLTEGRLTLGGAVAAMRSSGLRKAPGGYVGDCRTASTSAAARSSSGPLTMWFMT
ncbi:hypothetical protein AB0M23_18585 [Streptomyces sp. NPDC052077]|uniref:hypothetical protein n=1 Tax=Streptomyces sp. NPDC052077 TaxID=3154757 RepID=UPI003428878C